MFTSCTRFIILSRVIHFLVFQRPERLLHLFIKLCKVCFNFSFAIFVRVLWRKEIHNYNDKLRASSPFWGMSWKVEAREETRQRAELLSGIVALVASFAPSGARVQMMLRGTQINYSWTSRKRPPKTQRLSGRLREVVVYKNRTTGGLFREECQVHLFYGRLSIACNF